MLASLTLPAHSTPSEEFYIVTDAPIAVGGGIIRHYKYTKQGRVSTRYSYAGTQEDLAFIEKYTHSSHDDSTARELIKVPLTKALWSGKKGYLTVGAHNVSLELKEKGRIRVKEAKNR